ncbi:SHOCT domain-containing protein [Poseidonocella sp. HB161398]|uniref:SHOCT domain-containing protein n=1 Tax=Poseidonocella sp. HB161398 TaxID=2320855 RepID=UPI0011083B2E|nr:SHOCT domain-containing protein [Poseidonocella sp. HB161398]
MKRLAFLFPAALPAPALAQGVGHMTGWGFGSGFGMMLGPVIWLVLLGLAVAGAIWMARRSGATPKAPTGAEAQAELDLRLARGEITAEDYAALKKLLAH